MLQPIDPISSVRWLACLNVSGEEIPAFAAMGVNDADSNGTLEVGRPLMNRRTLVFNGPYAIPIGAYGECTRDFPCVAAYEEADGTPVAGQEWGVAPPGWKLRLNYTGFVIHGTVATGLALVSLQCCEPPVVANETTFCICDDEAPWSYMWDGGCAAFPNPNHFNLYGTLSNVVDMWTGLGCPEMEGMEITFTPDEGACNPRCKWQHVTENVMALTISAGLLFQPGLFTGNPGTPQLYDSLTCDPFEMVFLNRDIIGLGLPGEPATGTCNGSSTGHVRADLTVML